MSVQIQFFENIKESTLPIIRLTKSKNGKTGTATFVFVRPEVFEEYYFSHFPIKKISLVWEGRKIESQDITFFFHEGKPFLIKTIFLFKNSIEWFEFLNFMNSYSKETGLSFYTFK
jgi:photosystem II protein